MSKPAKRKSPKRKLPKTKIGRRIYAEDEINIKKKVWSEEIEEEYTHKKKLIEDDQLDKQRTNINDEQSIIEDIKPKKVKKKVVVESEDFFEQLKHLANKGQL